MLLKPMRFKDYTWPHNPEIYAVEYRRQIAAHKIPLGGWYLQDLGRTYLHFPGRGYLCRGAGLRGVPDAGGGL